MKSKVLILFVFFTFSFAMITKAQELQQDSISSVISAYRFYKDIDNISIKTPTVVEIPFTNDFIERFDFAVLDKNKSSFEPYFFKQETLVNETPMSVITNPNVDRTSNLIDKNMQTYTDFPLLDNEQGQAQITLTSANPITSSILNVFLDNNVALPTFVEIRAFIDDQSKIIVAKRKMDQQIIHFPQITSSKWQITFFYGQPLRISELQLDQDNIVKLDTYAIRFLAQPSHSYRVYFDPDRSTDFFVGEAGNLASAQDVFVIPEVSSQNNADYFIADIDNDGIADIHDNCVSVNNRDQQDINNNGRGDVCDDFDQDGLINLEDNCPDNPNENQEDADNDGIGDVCDKQESRITERYKWIPWIGIGFAAIVLIALLILMAQIKGRTE